MAREGQAIVLFGDVVGSRSAAGRATAWLRELRADLDATFGRERLARWDFTQGDELQGLLVASADPLIAVLHAALHPDPLPMRWAIVAGEVDEGTGPATQRTGPAFVAARDELTAVRARREALAVVSGDATADGVLRDVAPVLPVLLGGLSSRQREVARLLLLEGERQTSVADRLGVSRATVSVLVERGHVRSIDGLRRALRLLLEQGIARTARQGTDD